MTAKQFWFVDKYNISTWAIKNARGSLIITSTDREFLDKICLKHNECFIEEY